MSTIKSSTEHLTLNADGSGKDLKLQTNGTEQVIVKSDGNVGIGTSSPAQALQVNTSSGNAYMRVERASQSTGQVGLQIGGGTSSTDWFTYMPASSDDLAFFGNSQERMRIQSGGGISFNGDTAAANALDDYEEGTWTPTTTSSGYTISSNIGYYTKIGDVVQVSASFDITAVGAGNSTMNIHGFPYSAKNVSSHYQVGMVREIEAYGYIYVIQINRGTSVGAINSMDGVATGSNKIIQPRAHSFSLTYRI